MIRAIEVYDTFNPRRLLEVKFVLCNGLDGRYVAGYDMKKEEIDEGRTIHGVTETGRTFRSSYASMREYFYKFTEQNSEVKGELGVGERVKMKKGKL